MIGYRCPQWITGPDGAGARRLRGRMTGHPSGGQGSDLWRGLAGEQPRTVISPCNTCDLLLKELLQRKKLLTGAGRGSRRTRSAKETSLPAKLFPPSSTKLSLSRVTHICHSLPGNQKGLRASPAVARALQAWQTPASCPKGIRECRWDLQSL